MKKLMALTLACAPLLAAAQVKTDVYSTSVGDVFITPLGHGSLSILFDGRVIHVDPYSEAAHYATQPKADLVLLTHEHSDHFDRSALDQVVTPETEVIVNTSVGEIYDRENRVLDNGDVAKWNGVKIKAVPAYNLVHERAPGQPFHPKGVGNGYVLTFGDLKLYIAGDTEPIREMRKLKRIDVAFLPKNLPYTMDDEQFVEAAKIVKPKILYPYHFSEIDREKLQEQLPGIELK
jgi:L-ascorbate metabolism protein UlaG (beta-lactamase superfamily)